jgi:hypothetical protein
VGEAQVKEERGMKECFCLLVKVIRDGLLISNQSFIGWLDACYFNLMLSTPKHLESNYFGIQ